MNEDLFRRIKNTLKLEFYLMNDEWLRDCVEFFVNQNTNPSNEDILQFVKVQWQLSDLREINNENGSLPRNLLQQKLVTLSDNYILQVEQMYDIATSKYKQLEQIRNTHISEVDPSETEKLEKWEPAKKRMIQLRLTDGLQNIVGIEYNHIARLNDTLLPGYKVMIIGPVKCRKGVLLLEEGKLRGIGGEVDSLLIPNALENVLARALNLEENPDPYNDNESKPHNVRGQDGNLQEDLDSHNHNEMESHNIREQDRNLQQNLELYNGNESASHNVKENQETEIDDSFFEEDFEINLEEVSKIEDSHSTNNRLPYSNTTRNEIQTDNFSSSNSVQKEDQKSEEIIVLDDDDSFLEMVNEKQLVESQGEQKSIATPFRTLPTEGHDDVITLNDEEMIESVQYFEKKIQKEEQPSRSNSPANFAWPTNKAVKEVTSISKTNSKICKKQPETIQLLTGGKRAVPMSPETILPKKGKMDRKITEFSIRLNSSNVPKICEFIHDVKKEVITGITYRKIRGHVEVLGKLTKKDLSWILEATVADGTGRMEITFSNEVLENLLGFTVHEFSRKKKLKKDPEIEHELRMSFRNAEQKIKTLDALLELELNIDKKSKVIKITELTQDQKEATDKRLKDFFK